MEERSRPDLYMECGTPANVGDKAFNYYDMKAGVIGAFVHVDGWFDFQHEDGTLALLNKKRVCSIDYAKKKGWL